jgi:hypothetical protein
MSAVKFRVLKVTADDAEEIEEEGEKSINNR